MIGHLRFHRRLLVRGLLLAGGELLVRPGTTWARVLAQATPPAATPEATALPSTPVGRQLAWVVAQVNSGIVELTAEEVVAHFAPTFLQTIPASQLIHALREFAAAAPIAVEDYRELPDGTKAVALVATVTDDRWVVTIGIEPAEPHRITELGFAPFVPPATPEALPSWTEFDRRWTAFAPKANFLATEFIDADAKPVHAVNAGQRLAIGSAFKLYILGELARQVAAGTASWDEELAIEEGWKSLAGGDMWRLPAGTRRSLRTYAEQMISVSDNTASDHLLFFLGRENVEAAQATMGHGDPRVNVPFLSTREWLVFKLASSEADIDAYLTAPVAEKRRILAEEVATVAVSAGEATSWQTPRRIEEIEWFASAEDLGRAMAALLGWSRQSGLEPVAEILAINPGLPFDPATWAYVGYKGGSEPGVLNLTWLLQRADGRTFVMTAGLNDPRASLDETQAFLLLQSAARLLGQQS
jgi:beta-lactamase class A